MWLGNIVLGKTLAQGTSFKNISDHIIRIKNLTTSSSSIHAAIETKMLNPNDTLHVQVTIKPEKSVMEAIILRLKPTARTSPA